MRKSLLFTALLISVCLLTGSASAFEDIAPSTGGAGWTLYGSAAWDGERISLTSDEANAVGAAWFNQLIFLGEDFDLEFSVYLGEKDDDGADGIAFVLAPNHSWAEEGGGLGYSGLSPSLAIEIDTYPNDGQHLGGDIGDPLDDHLAIDNGGTSDHNVNQGAIKEVGNLEDGKEHNFRITWDAESMTLRAHLDYDYAPTIEYKGDIVNDFLDGNYAVFYGFTGSTGALSNVQYIVPRHSMASSSPYGVSLDDLTDDEASSTDSSPYEVNFDDLIDDDASLTGTGAFGWTLVASAYWSLEYIVLTPDEDNSAGAAWSDTTIDLSNDFNIQHYVYLGEKDEDGADGIAFVLTKSEGAADIGAGLGYDGLSPAFAVELDTYPNDGAHLGQDFGDPTADHIAINAGIANHYEYSGPIAEVANLEDGSEHLLTITWDASATTLQVYLDMDIFPVVEYTGDIAAQFFGGNNTVRYGFTGATGACSNMQYFVP